MYRNKIAVIGGGASGLAAAITAAENAEVTIFEKNDRVGKKILQTGNGRCNIFNETLSPDCYNNEKLARQVFAKVGTAQMRRFFGGLGLLLRSEDEGRVYPLCNQASAVLDVLRYAAAERGVKTLCGFDCSAVRRTKNGFELHSAEGDRHFCDALIIACGGKAAPKTGSDGSGYGLARQLGHSITPTAPALVPLKLNSAIPRALKGIRAKAGVTLLKNGREIARESGEIQFTEYGISGIAVMQLSRLVRGKGCEIVIDFAEGFEREEIYRLLFEARKKPREVQDIALGIVQKRVAQQVIKRCTDISLAAPASMLDDEVCSRLARMLKGLRLEVSGTLSWDNAQITAGGIPEGEINPEDMQSRLCRGLYFAGEILDCDGKCGGYNLGWAWATGIIAGRAAAQKDVE